MKISRRILIFFMASCLLLNSSCVRKQYYMSSVYSKEEILEMFYDNRDLFDAVAKIVSENETFRKEGIASEGERKVCIFSPYSDNLKYFNDDDKSKIIDFFELMPYEIFVHISGLFVYFCFISNRDEYVYPNSYQIFYYFDNPYEDYQSLLSYVKSWAPGSGFTTVTEELDYHIFMEYITKNDAY